LLPPESAGLEQVAREVGVVVATLERWRADAQSRPARERAWTAGARLEAVVTTASMNEAAGAWCRSHGAYPGTGKWRAVPPRWDRVRPGQPAGHAADRKRIKGSSASCAGRALAETAALLVLSKKVQAIFNKGEDE
jgi:hypothetical protein